MLRLSKQAIALSLFFLMLVESENLRAQAQEKFHTAPSSPKTHTGKMKTCRGHLENELNSIAKYIAGRQQHPCSKLASAKKKQASLDPLRKKYAKNNRTLLQWWKSRSSDIKSPELFYPFGGPDISNAVLLFPESKSFTLFGLEDIGSIPDIRKYEKMVRKSRLSNKDLKMRRALRSILRLNFFITSQMQKDFNPYSHVSLVEIFLFFLSYQGAEIHSVNHIRLTSEGEVEKQHGRRAVLSGGTPGLSVVFSLPGYKERKEMRYFQLNAGNTEMQRNHRDFLRYMEKRTGHVTLIKAASYLMNSRNGQAFQTMRSIVLKNSSAIVQDDSGISVEELRKKGWELSVHGIYDGTLKVFKAYRQNELFKLTKGNQPLPFSWGYTGGHRPGKSLLIIAKPQS